MRRPGSNGQPDRTNTYEVRIPVGIREGQRIRLAGQGGAGEGGGVAGDLFLRVRLARHPELRVNGTELYYDLDLAPWEAALGVQARIPALDGATTLRVPPGTTPGTQLRLRGLGLPGGRGQARRSLRYRAHTDAGSGLAGGALLVGAARPCLNLSTQKRKMNPSDSSQSYSLTLVFVGGTLPAARYSIEVTARLAGLHPELLRHYCRLGFFGEARAHPDIEPIFDDDGLYEVRRFEHYRRVHGIKRKTLGMISGLWREIERLQAEVRFLHSS